MNEILKVVLSLSLSGALLILVLLLCKPLFRNRISKRWQYYIWLVIIARLLLPFTPETSPVGTLFHKVDRVIVQADTVPVPRQNIAPILGDNTVIKNETVPKSRETDAAPIPERFFSAVIQNLWLAWLVMALILIIRKITIYQGFVKYIRAGRSEVSDTAILDRLALIGEQVGIKKPVELYTNGLISSPLLLGFFRPCIVLPSTDLSLIDLDYTLLHELTHYKRRDMFYKWLVQFAICLHWFNPLVYVMGREVGRTCELACDEAVIKALDPQGRRAYGDTLLNAIGAGGSYKNALASVTLNESKELLKERLDAIMKYKRTTKIVGIITVALTTTLLCASSFIGAYAADFKVNTNIELQSIQSTTTILNDEQNMRAIDISATVGNLTILYGDNTQIEIGGKLVNHASFSYDNGTLTYRDDLERNNQSFEDFNNEKYKIIITIPHDLELETLSANVGIGSINLQNIMANNAKLTGTTKINLDGFHSAALNLNSTLADISAANISVSKELSIYSYGSTAIVSGDIKGNVLIDSAGISNTNITFVNSDRSNYYIESTWEPESQNKEPGNFLLESGNVGILIDGEKYSVEYKDSNIEAPNKLTIISRELMPMDNIAISFAK